MASLMLLGGRGRKLWFLVTASVAIAGLLAVGPLASAQAQTTSPNSIGELDCNGDSPIQQSVRMSAECTDIRGFNNEDNANTWDGRFYDNGTYIGHDEPDMTFFSGKPGSGNDVTWSETLGREPSAAPTDSTPGSDVAHWFELSIAPWHSMMLCDPNSYPQNACTPESDTNAPDPCTISANPCANGYAGGGSAFMELQFYPPGFAPFDDAISCDNKHWCAALTIDSLECTYGFTTCNSNCEEPMNFAFVQRDGVPAGPAGPEESDLATYTQNSQTLLMNPGDRIIVHMSDAPVPGQRGVKAFEAVVYDLTTHQRGLMQASAANGFETTSIADCSGIPFNFQPAYNTASYNNVTPWGADRTNISTEYETGHWEPCTSLTDPGSLTLAPNITDTFYSTCHGPYEDTVPGGDGPSDPEISDAFCYPKGDAHGALNTAPDTMTGCIDNYTQNGDLDFDGPPYWPEWPTGARPTNKFPGSFVESLPTTSGGSQYSQYQILTDLGLSESTCAGNTIPTGTGTPAGCAAPPPNAPGKFYPYWSRVSTGAGCALEFGNVRSGPGVNDLGGDAQYGTDQAGTLGYPLLLGPVQSNTCNRRF
jgi:hypothetical protein